VSVPSNVIEIGRLLAVVERELADAGMSGLSDDGSFEHSYNASLTIATIVVRAHAERIKGMDHHRLTFVRLGELSTGRWAGIADYLQHCRVRRNTAVYDVSGSVSKTEARELFKEATRFLTEVIAWLRRDHPELLSG
jgi:hypothetical protein